MDKFTKKIKVLNDAYKTVEISLNKIVEVFPKNTHVKHKVRLIKAMLNDLYKSVLNNLESEHVNKEFAKIIKQIKDEK